MSDNQVINEVDGPALEDMEIEDSNPLANDPNAVNSGFPPIAKLYEEVPHKVFDDPSYYKSLMADGGDGAKRLHGIFQKYATEKDPKNKAVFRQQIANPYWDFAAATARNAPVKLTLPQQFMLRFGVLHPNLLKADSKAFLSKLIVDSDLEQPIYYLDEWMKLIGTGQVKISETDEVQSSRGNENAHFKSLLEKANGKLEGSRGLLRAKSVDRNTLEKTLTQYINTIMTHPEIKDLPDIGANYTETQKSAWAAACETLKGLAKTDREISLYLKDFESAMEDIESIKQKISASDDGGGGASVDFGSIDTEFGSIRQMAKMTVGRQGNAFPILSGEYFGGSPNGVGFRENVISKLAWIESIDAEAFIRFYKNKPNRIVPYTILLPTYGDLGMCWQPFEKSNRATSRGHIAIPMYPKNLTIAVLYAVGDLRWQAAKEKASFYWMEEGLTGNYYQWFQAQKLKGDVKLYFIQDYIAWMTKESEGTQKLDKDVRGTFWRYMPFTQAVKEKLKDRNLVYQELYQRDKNRASSDL
ncbi:MAG: hypothetical protein Ta2B_09870 [Termitinemataceae bacterium]|nr:MAG: hypothetical protein Ta2B_09870 [Termitinemataceae bacterium]